MRPAQIKSTSQPSHDPAKMAYTAALTPVISGQQGMTDAIFKTPLKQTMKEGLEIVSAATELAGRYASLQHSQQVMNRNTNQSLNGTMNQK